MVFNYCYVSSACNPIPTIADWGKNNLICYGACNSVLIYDLTVSKYDVFNKFMFFVDRNKIGFNFIAEMFLLNHLF